MDGAIHTAATQQSAIGCIHDGVDIERRYVGDNDVEDSLTDLGRELPHARNDITSLRLPVQP